MTCSSTTSSFSSKKGKLLRKVKKHTVASRPSEHELVNGFVFVQDEMLQNFLKMEQTSYSLQGFASKAEVNAFVINDKVEIISTVPGVCASTFSETKNQKVYTPQTHDEFLESLHKQGVPSKTPIVMIAYDSEKLKAQRESGKKVDHSNLKDFVKIFTSNGHGLFTSTLVISSSESFVTGSTYIVGVSSQ
jgi:hypothetical protein